jgi:ABC-type uncharacterized transport system auxiliary subunit
MHAMNPLKRLTVLIVLFAALAIAGCGVGSTQQETWRQVSRVANYDARMMVDDLSLLTQTHRPLRNSRWILP